MKEMLRENRYYYWMIAALAVAGGVVLALYPKTDVTLWVNNHWSRAMDTVMLVVNNMGSLIFSILTVLMLWWWRGWRIAVKATCCFLAVSLMVQLGKHLFFPGMERPTVYFERFDEVVLRLVEGVTQLRTETFPSGHTAAAFAMATFFALYLPDKRWHWLLALLALSVGYARIYLSQHFSADVYAGMLIGVVVCSLVYYFYPIRWEQR